MEIQRTGLAPAPWEPAVLAEPPRPLPADLSQIAALPANVRMNDPFADSNPMATQSEAALAAVGDRVVVAWNDGQGISPVGDLIGWGYSFNGGVSFKDMGAPPHPAAWPSWRWTSDPVVAVNEKTGRFYLTAMANANATTSALGVAFGHFVDTLFVWDNTIAVRTVSLSASELDKPWIVADSSGAGTWVYISNTTFTSSGNRIDFQRSTDGGTNWSAPVQLSNLLDNGYVQGSRPAVGPAGEVYVVWEADDPDTSADYVKIRKSVDRGASFAAEVTVALYIRNDGTGAPGFNRPRGISFPSIAIDRTTGQWRGRVYLAWNEPYNWIDDNFFGGPLQLESEPNNAAASATPFSAGDQLRGTVSAVQPVADIDWYRVFLLAGQSLLVYCDSIPDGQTYSMRIHAPAPDSLQRLTFGGDTDPTDDAVFGGPSTSAYCFTAPTGGNYYLRFAPFAGTTGGGTPFYGVTGNYRIRTRLGNVHGRGKDQRDVFSTMSQTGTTWLPPQIVNHTEDPGYDDFLPEIAVGADGLPYIQWYDHRDDLYGSRTHQYIARSDNGGLSWPFNQRVTTFPGNFTISGTNIVPNIGDYGRLWSDERFLRGAWGDGRGTSVDSWGARIDVMPQIGCPTDTSVMQGRIVLPDVLVANHNALFENTYKVSVTSQRSWPLPPLMTVRIGAGKSAVIEPEVFVPDTAALGKNQLCVKVENATGTSKTTCCLNVTVTQGVLSAGDPRSAGVFALRPPAPNPAVRSARLEFTLPAAGPARLAVYGLRGERVRTLVDGPCAAGVQRANWDGRDDRGHPSEAGVYFVRLEAAGRTATHRLVWMR